MYDSHPGDHGICFPPGSIKSAIALARHIPFATDPLEAVPGVRDHYRGPLRVDFDRVKAREIVIISCGLSQGDCIMGQIEE